MDINIVDTSDSRQKVYETNLLSLFYFRAAQESSIERFHFVKNIERSTRFPPFSDIRLKIKIKWHHKAITVFIQALHKTNKNHFLEIDLAAYFETYVNIKQKCDENQFLLIVYTNAKVDTEYTDDSARNALSAKLNDILNTGGKVKCLNNEENIEYLTNKIVKDQITSLAKTIARYIDNKHNFQRMMQDELVLRYHLILAQKVFDISDVVQTQIPINAPQHRIASFRYDFLINEEEYMMLFKVTLFLEFIKERKLKPDEIQLYLSEFMDDPTATRLSKLIGTAVSYNSGQIEFNKQLTEAFRSKPMDFLRATDYKAVALAATAILSSVMFKVPAAFGNKDLTISGSDAEIEKRICYLASTMKELLDKCDESKIVTIDESLGNGFLELDGGVAGAIGNIFVLDENTQLMKITDNWESLNTLAQRLYKKLKDVIHNLHKYTFCFKVEKFPELLIDNYGKKMATDFLNNFLVYYNQAEQSDVQQILKNEIEDIQLNEPNHIQIKNDVIFLRYHNEIHEIWRMLEQPESNLTLGNIYLFRKSKDAILVDPLIHIISELYFNKIKQYDYTFTEDAVSSLNLSDRPCSGTILVTENCELTAVKVLQYFNDEVDPCVVLDVEYIASLPANDQNALRAELKDAQEEFLIIISDKVNNSHEKTLENIANAVRNKSIIVICNQKTLKMLHKYFAEADNMLHDKKFSLIDVDIESQRRILNDATAIFPGVEIRLGVLLRGWPRTDQTSRSAATGGSVAVADKDEADNRVLAAKLAHIQQSIATCMTLTKSVTAVYETGIRSLLDDCMSKLTIASTMHQSALTTISDASETTLRILSADCESKLKGLSAASEPAPDITTTMCLSEETPQTRKRIFKEDEVMSEATGSSSTDTDEDDDDDRRRRNRLHRFYRLCLSEEKLRQLKRKISKDIEKYSGDEKSEATGSSSTDTDEDDDDDRRRLNRLRLCLSKQLRQLKRKISREIEKYSGDEKSEAAANRAALVDSDRILRQKERLKRRKILRETKKCPGAVKVLADSEASMKGRAVGGVPRREKASPIAALPPGKASGEAGVEELKMWVD